MKKRSGLTLLEVVVALVLVATVLVSALSAFSKHRKQLVMADKRIEAVQIADQLVHQLSAGKGGIPVAARGAVIGKTDWIWQTSLVGNAVLTQLPVQVVRFQIVDLNEPQVALVTVEVVKPVRMQ